VSPPPRILDPLAVPVVGTDAHLPAIAAHRLHPQALRERFADRRPWTAEWPGDGVRFPDREPARASVLVPLIDRAGGLTVLLTRRATHLRDHAGQISFPGGRAEPEDADPAATALREAQEEIGLDPQSVEVIGQLPTYTTVTHFVVTPVVGLVAPPPVTLVLDPFEVDAAFEVPLEFLMTPAHHRRHAFDADGASRLFLSMPWQGPGPDGTPLDAFIWGATAAMLRNLYAYLARVDVEPGIEG
jgi:8-oxo-dGTP pyrophosphatase MutT (NUDIX family)